MNKDRIKILYYLRDADIEITVFSLHIPRVNDVIIFEREGEDDFEALDDYWEVKPGSVCTYKAITRKGTQSIDHVWVPLERAR